MVEGLFLMREEDCWYALFASFASMKIMKGCEGDVDHLLGRRFLMVDFDKFVSCRRHSCLVGTYGWYSNSPLIWVRHCRFRLTRKFI